MVSVDVVGIKTNKSSLSFRGHNIDANSEGSKVYKFYLPKVSYNNASLVLRKFLIDDNGNVKPIPKSSEIKIPYSNSNPVLEVDPSDLKLRNNEILGYRFIIDDKDFNDRSRFIDYDDKKYNISTPSSANILQTPSSIYHILPNTFNPNTAKKTYIDAYGHEVNVDAKTVVMNHVMKYDSTLNDVIEKIPHIKKMGFKRILSTPIFGQDTLSSHGYWTANPFQITESLGHIEDFDDLQINLFKNSMGFIADGAFTDEGLTGIHFMDILRNGKQSPFVNWFELHNFPLKKIGLGILPDTEKGYANMDIRVVNSPVIWSLNKEGKPVEDFGKENPNYNPHQETFIQLYDRRLTSTQQLNEDRVFLAYDIKNPLNKEDISGWTDSVLPYAFPVDATEIIKRAKLVITASRDLNDESIPAKEFLKSWEHFELTQAQNSSGVTLWTGNKDIAKLRFTAPVSKQNNFKKEAISHTMGEMTTLDVLKSTTQVQEYIKKVGIFWTNRTSKTLRRYIAQQLASANSPQEIHNTILSKAGSSLPAELKYLTLNQIEKADSVKNNNQAPTRIEEMFLEYPPEALEVNPFISSLFAYPVFQTNMEKILYSGSMKKATLRLLSEIDKARNSQNKLLDNNMLNPQTAAITQLISDDIARFLLIKGVAPKFDIDSLLAPQNSKFYEALKNISLDKMLLEKKTPEERAAYLLDKMNKNISNISADDIKKMSNYLANKIKNITPMHIKVSNLILDKTEAGLNWRIDAAKDIAEIENFNENEVSVEETWQEILNFWADFNNGVKRYNKHSYQIGEFTDTNFGYNQKNEKFKSAGQLEQSFMDKGSFTTQTNYSYLFSLLQSLYGGFAENGQGMNVGAFEELVPKLLFGWEDTPGYLYSGNKNNLSFSHVAVGNHDKQRISHTFSMNMPLAYNEWNEGFRNQIYDDLMSSSLHYASFFDDLRSSKSLDGNFYPETFGEKFGNVLNKVSPKNLTKMAALTDAFNEMLKTLSPNDIEQYGDKEYLLQKFTSEVEKIALNGKPEAKMFFYRNYETNIADIIKVALQEQDNFAEFLANNQGRLHKELTKQASIRGKELAKMMVALPGAPTLYAGDELLESGGEEKSRNVYLQNRNRLHWENLNDKENYSHVLEHKEALEKIFNLRNDKNLTSLINGDTTLLKWQGDAGDGRYVLGLYRYNDNDDSIILVHNRGFNSSRRLPDDAARKTKINYIDMGQGLIEQIGNRNYAHKTLEKEVGLPNKLEAGRIFVDALDENRHFVVHSDGNIYKMSQSGEISYEPIELDGSVTILKRAK